LIIDVGRKGLKGRKIIRAGQVRRSMRDNLIKMIKRRGMI
jgi:hypothetical protein